MRIDPPTGTFFTSQFAPKGAAPNCKLSELRAAVRGLKAAGGVVHDVEIEDGGRTYSVSFIVADDALRSLTITAHGDSGHTYAERLRFYEAVLERMGIRAGTYSWGGVGIESMPQSGELWIAVAFTPAS